jgi:hypothetical protein
VDSFRSLADRGASTGWTSTQSTKGRNEAHSTLAAEVQQFGTGTELPNTQTQVDKIRALGASSGDEDEVNKILDTVQADIDNAKSAGEVEDSTFADSNALAKQYGLKVCGQD